MPIEPDELKDFYDEIRRAKRKVSDFELREEPENSPGAAQLGGVVFIRNVKTGIERHYSTGHQTSWVFEFHKDLLAGEYD